MTAESHGGPVVKRTLLPFLVLMSLLGVFPVDVVLPSFSALSRTFAVDIDAISLSVSLFALGVAVSQCGIGPLSDRIGRTRLLRIGLLVAALATLGCALSSSYIQFMAFRVLQALGCGCFVLSQAIIQDRYAGHERNAMRIAMTTASGLFITLSPLAGSALQRLAGWQASFYVFIGLVLLALLLSARPLRESHPISHSCSVTQRYSVLLRDTRFMAYSLLSALAFACHFSFIVVSPLLLMDRLRLSEYGFSLVFLGYGSAYVLGGLVASALNRRVRAHIQMRIGLGLIGIAGLVLVFWLTHAALSIAALLVPMIICTAGTTLVRPAATTAALERHPSCAGTAAALCNTLLFATGGLASGLIARLETGLPMGLGYGFIGVSLGGVMVLRCLSPARGTTIT